MNYNIFSWLAGAFLAGLSTGAVCVGICGGILFPLIMNSRKSLVKNFFILLSFSLGRLIAYLIFGMVIGFISSYLTKSLLFLWIISAGYLLSAILLLKYISEKNICDNNKISKLNSIPFVLGLIAGFNFCPPFIFAITTAANAGTPLLGAIYFAAFFFGTSIYLIPFPFLGSLTKWIFFQRIGKIAGIIVSFIYIFIALNSFHSLLYPRKQSLKAANVVKNIPAEYKEIYPTITKIKHSKNNLNVFEAFSSNKFLGYLIDSRFLNSPPRGYGGETPLLLFTEKKRKKIKLLPNNETPQFLSYVLKSKWWTNISDNPDSALKLDSVSGATMTSESLRQTIISALENLNTCTKESTTFVIKKRNFADFVLESAPVILLIIFSVLIHSFKKLRNNWTVWGIRAASIFILGFYQVNYFSINSIALFVKSGLPSVIHFSWYLIFIFALASPLFFGRVYCKYICPFGAMTDVLYKIVPVKMTVPAKVFNRLINLKYYLLIIVLVLIVVLPDFPTDKTEPFQAVFMRHGARPYMIFAAAVLFFSCFLKRFWCNIFCIDGALFEFINSSSSDKFKNEKL